MVPLVIKNDACDNFLKKKKEKEKEKEKGPGERDMKVWRRKSKEKKSKTEAEAGEEKGGRKRDIKDKKDYVRKKKQRGVKEGGTGACRFALCCCAVFACVCMKRNRMRCDEKKPSRKPRQPQRTGLGHSYTINRHASRVRFRPAPVPSRPGCYPGPQSMASAPAAPALAGGY